MIKYSLQASPFPDSKDLNNAQIPTGTKIYAYYEPFIASEAAYRFFDNGVQIGNPESSPPIELNNNNGWIPTAGTHAVVVRDKSNNAKATANFTVQSVQPEPPSGMKEITLKLKSDNSEVAKIQYDTEKVEVVQ